MLADPFIAFEIFGKNHLHDTLLRHHESNAFVTPVLLRTVGLCHRDERLCSATEVFVLSIDDLQFAVAGRVPHESLLRDGYEWTAPVESFLPNGYGLYE
jgi:hypothetical protein